VGGVSMTQTGDLNLLNLLAWLLSFVFLAALIVGIIWLVVSLFKNSQGKKRQEEELDKLIDQKVEAKLKNTDGADSLKD